MSGYHGSPVQSETPDFHRAVLRHSQDLTLILDAEGVVTWASDAMRSLLGRDPEEQIGRSIFELLHPDEIPEQRARLARVLEEPGRVVRAEVRIRHEDGQWRAFEGVGKNLLGEPPVDGILVNLMDVTELREATRRLEATHELLQELVTHAPVVLWKVDAEGVFQLSEGRGLEGLGLEPGEVVGKNVFEVYADDPDAVGVMRRALAGEEVETRLRVAGRTYEGRVRPILEDGRVVGAVGVALDVTEWARQSDRAAFRARLLDSVGQAVIATDSAGRVIYWNETAEEMYGWSREEALGGSVMDLTVPEPLYESASDIMEALREGERWSGEYTVQRKDGSQFPAYVTNVPVVEDGELVAMIGVSADLTEEKELEAQLRRAQKMEAVAQLAGGIAHDFNNLLTTIGGYASLAADRTADQQVAADLEEVRQATRRARGLADKLLAFSRRRSTRVEPLDVNALLRQMLAALKRVVGDAVELELQLSDRPWPVVGDTGLLEQSLINLAANARDAMPDGGRLILSTDRVSLTADRARELEAEVEPGDYMRLVVEDTGAGIDPSIRERIYDPFFTTKEVGQGSGLGLSMVFGAMKQAGGAVMVESAPGRGARFTLFLPRAGTAVDARPERPSEPASAEPTVLVVEDEAAVRNLASRVLEREGYRVLQAASGLAAHRLILEEERDVDLVVTDVIMPEMSGPELVQRVRDVHPDIAVVFMSGYTADELESRGLDRTHETFLPKPFSPADLAGAVRAALGD